MEILAIWATQVNYADSIDCLVRRSAGGALSVCENKTGVAAGGCFVAASVEVGVVVRGAGGVRTSVDVSLVNKSNQYVGLKDISVGFQHDVVV